MKYEIKYTKQFKKDYELAKKQNKDLGKLFSVIETLINGEILEEKYKDHYLKGKFNNYKECHIEPDWLLIYKHNNEKMVLILYGLGSHSYLFK